MNPEVSHLYHDSHFTSSGPTNGNSVEARERLKAREENAREQRLLRQHDRQLEQAKEACRKRAQWEQDSVRRDLRSILERTPTFARTLNDEKQKFRRRRRRPSGQTETSPPSSMSLSSWSSSSPTNSRSVERSGNMSVQAMHNGVKKIHDVHVSRSHVARDRNFASVGKPKQSTKVNAFTGSYLSVPPTLGQTPDVSPTLNSLPFIYEENTLVNDTENAFNETGLKPRPMLSYQDRQFSSSSGHQLLGKESKLVVNEETELDVVAGKPVRRDSRYEWYSSPHHDNSERQGNDETLFLGASNDDAQATATSPSAAYTEPGQVSEASISDFGSGGSNSSKDPSKRPTTNAEAADTPGSLVDNFYQNKGVDLQRRSHHAVMAIVRVQARHERRMREADAAIVERASRAARAALAGARTRLQYYRGFQGPSQESLAQLSNILSSSLEVGDKTMARPGAARSKANWPTRAFPVTPDTTRNAREDIIRPRFYSVDQ